MFNSKYECTEDLELMSHALGLIAGSQWTHQRAVGISCFFSSLSLTVL